jgi:hypothetical protein
MFAALALLSAPVMSLIILARTGRISDQSPSLERSIRNLDDRLRTLSAQLQRVGEHSTATAASPRIEEDVSEPRRDTSVDPAQTRQAPIWKTLEEKIIWETLEEKVEELNARSSTPEKVSHEEVASPPTVEPPPIPLESIEQPTVHLASEAADPTPVPDPVSEPAAPEAASNPPAAAGAGRGAVRLVGLFRPGALPAADVLDPKGVPARPRWRAGDISCTLVHRSWAGADGYRLALSTPVVSAADGRC